MATLHRVFRRLDVATFKQAVGQWAATVTDILDPQRSPAGIAVDGKVLRASRQPAVPAVHLLAALGHDLGLVLAEARVGAGAEEATTLPVLLADLMLAGQVLTLNAAFTERPVAEAILAKGGLPDGGQAEPTRPVLGGGAALCRSDPRRRHRDAYRHL